MAESRKQRELRDKRRGLLALNTQSQAIMQRARQRMAIFDDGTDDTRYNAAKADLKKLDADVIARNAEIELIDTQLSALADAEAKEKRTKKITDKKNELKKAEEMLERDKAATLKAEIEALENAQITAGAADSPSATNEEYEGDNEFIKDVRAKGLALTTDPETGGSWVSGTEGANQTPQFIYIGEASRPSTATLDALSRRDSTPSMPYTPATSYFDALRKRIIEDSIKSPRGLKGLFDDLRGSGLRIPQVDYDRLDTTSTSFGQALSYALQKHTKAMVNDLEQNKNINPKSFFKYIQEDLKDSSVTGPKVSYDEFVTKVDEAESDLNRFFMEYVGRGATDEEQKRYYKQLRALEKKNAQVTTTKETDSGGTSQVTTGEFRLDAEDILQLQRGIAGKALDGSDIDVIL
jgi:hypothetical protein